VFGNFPCGGVGEMINLKKLFRRKKGQGALEYLFMIAAALIIIFVVVRYISGTGQQATSQSDIAALQSQAELVKSSFQAKGWWDTAKVQYTQSSHTLTLDTDGDTSTTTDDQYPYTVTQSDYPNLYSSSDISWEAVTSAYNKCQAGNITYCEIFGVLASATS